MNKIKTAIIVTSIFLTVLFFSQFSLAATYYYVATNGSDSNPGSINQPFKTINRGASVLSAGDTLYIRGGTYNETANISNSGTVSAPITISSHPGEWAVIDGQDTIPGYWGVLFNIDGNYVVARDLEVKNSAWMGVRLNGQYDQALRIKSHHNMENGILVTGNYGLVENSEIWWNAKSNEYYTNTRGGWSGGLNAARHPQHATLRGNKVWNNWGEGLSTYEAEYTTLEDNIVYDNMKNVYFSDTQYAILRRNLIYCTPGNTLYNSAQVGIAMSDEVYNPPSSNNAIINNFVMGCSGNLVHWGDSTGWDNHVIANNTFVNAVAGDRTNFSVSPGGFSQQHSNTRIENNLFLQEDSSAIATMIGPSGLSFSNNLWSKTPAEAAQGTGDIIADPKLAKTGSTAPGQLTADWFKLLSNSPAINKAKVITEVTEDYFKTVRGSSPDIGAHEYVSGTPDATPPAAPTGVRIK